MNAKKLNRLFPAGSLLLIALLACRNGPASTPVSSSPTQTEETASTAPAQYSTPPASLPEVRLNQAGDADSSVDAGRKRAPGGDAFVKNLYERPFNAETMDTYFPYLDILDTQGYKDAEWGYATITLSGTDAEGHLPGKYGVELDLNADGRGEWLILVSNPSSVEWSTREVQAWNDANGDIGGKTPTYADEAAGGDGYEILAVDLATGDGPDWAWARLSPDDPKTVNLAFRLSGLNYPDSYVMGAWAGADSLDPAKLDFNDHLTHMEAGSPLPDLFVYPLKGLAQVDNTCRMAIGFIPVGDEPGLCQTISPEEAGCPDRRFENLPLPCR